MHTYINMYLFQILNNLMTLKEIYIYMYLFQMLKNLMTLKEKDQELNITVFFFF